MFSVNIFSAWCAANKNIQRANGWPIYCCWPSSRTKPVITEKPLDVQPQFLYVKVKEIRLHSEARFHQAGSERNPRTPKCNRIEPSTCSTHPYGMLRADAQRPASGTHGVPTKDQGGLASPLPSESVLSAAAYCWSPDRGYRKAQGVAVNCSEAPAEQAGQGP